MGWPLAHFIVVTVASRTNKKLPLYAETKGVERVQKLPVYTVFLMPCTTDVPYASLDVSAPWENHARPSADIPSDPFSPPGHQPIYKEIRPKLNPDHNDFGDKMDHEQPQTAVVIVIGIPILSAGNGVEQRQTAWPQTKITSSSTRGQEHTRRHKLLSTLFLESAYNTRYATYAKKGIQPVCKTGSYSPSTYTEKLQNTSTRNHQDTGYIYEDKGNTPEMDRNDPELHNTDATVRHSDIISI